VATDLGRDKLLYKIARTYYEDGLTQSQIGRRFGLSRIKVSRLLKEARDRQLVQISIIPPDDPNADLERHLEAAFGLKEAVIVTPPSYDVDTIRRALGEAAALYLVRCLTGREVIGVTWGTFLLATVDALSIQNWPAIRVVQTLGGLGQPEAATHGADLARRTAQALGGRPRLLSAPGIVASKEIRDALLADPQISDTLALGASADVALVGIGALVPGVLAARLLPKHDVARLRVEGAIGDVGLRFFGPEGESIQDELNDRIIGLELEQFRQIARVVGVAGALDKFEAIRGALRGGLVNVLVTDDRVAMTLLQYKNDPDHVKRDHVWPLEAPERTQPAYGMPQNTRAGSRG
jgi:DNA-binding transcriptional regulator LsrR (DeoR family)